MTRGEARGVWFGIRSSFVSVLFSDAAVPAASKTVKRTYHLSKYLCRLGDDTCVVGGQHAPDKPPLACRRLLVSAHPNLFEVNEVPYIAKQKTRTTKNSEYVHIPKECNKEMEAKEKLFKADTIAVRDTAVKSVGKTLRESEQVGGPPL